MNFARLNHILIPETAEQRSRLRASLLGKLIDPLVVLFWMATQAGRGALVLWLLVGGLSLEVGTTHVYIVWCGMSGLLLASAIVRRYFRLDGVSLGVDAPKRTTVGEPTRFALQLTHAGTKSHRGVYVEGPFLPWDGRWVGEPEALTELRPGRTGQVECCAVFEARGLHHLEPFRACMLSSFGLFFGPPTWSKDARFLVVPKIPPIARLVTPTVRRYQPGGIAMASKTGESMEILGVRPYRPGDPMRDLHARTWARTGVPAVREYQEEYFTRLGVVVDTDQLGTDSRQFEAALSVAAGVVAHLSRGEALIDLLVVGNTVHALTLGRSLGFLEQALDLLACVHPGPSLRPGELARRMAPHLPRLSCLVFVALRWDPPRMEFVDQIRSFGVGCQTLIIDPPTKGRDGRASSTSRVPEQDLVHVPTSAVEQGVPLWL